MRKLFRVSTKAAIYNPSREKVIAIHMDESDAWGLPGGHIEDGESPDEAISRELMEECGIVCTEMRRVDFFLHGDGKLVLAYVGTTENESLVSLVAEQEGIPRWLDREEFMKINIEPSYRSLVLSGW